MKEYGKIMIIQEFGIKVLQVYLCSLLKPEDKDGVK